MKKLLLATSLLLLGISASAHAMTYDFAAEGNEHEAGYLSFDSDNHSNTNPGHTGDPTTTAATVPLDMPGGLTITASNGGRFFGNPMAPGGIPSEDKTYYAYMDGTWIEPAGLGVCKDDTNSCGSDDNQKDGEFIHMVFDEVVNILSLDITGNHTTVDDGIEFKYSLDGGVTWNSEDLDGQQRGANVGGIADISFAMLGMKTLDYTILSGLGKQSEIYLSAMAVSAVPVPAAVWLFGTAILGLAGFSKRRKVAQA